MLIHIVKTGETVDKITNSYRILKNDLISNNQHITDFSNLKSGMKLKIPLLSKDNIETLEETEAFIDDYYPSFEKFLSSNETIIADSTDKQTIINNCDIITQEEVVEEKATEKIIEVKYEEPKEEYIEQQNITKQKEEYVGQQNVEQQNVNKSYNNNIFHNQVINYYRGNVIPNYNQKYIKKI